MEQFDYPASIVFVGSHTVLQRICGIAAMLAAEPRRAVSCRVTKASPAPAARVVAPMFDDTGGGPHRPVEMMRVRFLVTHAAIAGGASTSRNRSSGSGRCSAIASGHGALSQVSISSRVVKMTGIALSWIGFTTPFGSVVKKPNSSWSCGPSLTRRMPCQRVQMPAKKKSGFVSSIANQKLRWMPVAGSLSPGVGLGSAKLVAGTMQRCSTPSHCRQCQKLGPANVRRPVVRLALHAIRRRRHAPIEPYHLTLAIGRSAHDRRLVVGVDIERWFKIAGPVMHRP